MVENTLVRVSVRHDWLHGVLKFSPNISVQKLIEVATDIKNALEKNPDEAGKLKTLGIRQYAERPYRFSIFFAYEFDGTEATGKKLVYRITDKLKRRFGNDFVGWDISTELWLIK
jgi:hypothetical protein